MSGIKHFKRAETKFEAFGGPPGQSGIARLVGPELSKTMGVGWPPSTAAPSNGRCSMTR